MSMSGVCVMDEESFPSYVSVVSFCLFRHGFSHQTDKRTLRTRTPAREASVRFWPLTPPTCLAGRRPPGCPQTHPSASAPGSYEKEASNRTVPMPDTQVHPRRWRNPLRLNETVVLESKN